MKYPSVRTALCSISALVAAAQLSGCASNTAASYVATEDRECLARVMYFESMRSSDDGMLAVGTVVMNRLNSGLYPNTVCGVIGQRNQFAPGALTKPMLEGRSAALAHKVADEVLSGKRHPGLTKNVMFFHTHGYHFPYTNMRYVLVAGGNIFYFKDNNRSSPSDVLAASRQLAYAGNVRGRTVGALTGGPSAAIQVAVNDQPAAAPVVQETSATAAAGAQESTVAQMSPAAEAPTPRAQPAEEAAPAVASAGSGDAPAQ